MLFKSTGGELDDSIDASGRYRTDMISTNLESGALENDWPLELTIDSNEPTDANEHSILGVTSRPHSMVIKGILGIHYTVSLES